MTRQRRAGIAIWIGFWLVWLVLLIQPENRGLLRLAVVLIIVMQLLAGLALFRALKPLCYGIITLLVLPLLLIALPGRPYDTEALRQSYVASLERYDGTPYIWGGENRIGIDCSGLVRRGLICATLQRGIYELNGQLIRAACRLWWYDASAEAMGEGYRGETLALFETPSLNELDHGRLLPGDFAVTANGVHTLVYVGQTTWMQADPGRGRAQYETIPVTDSGWFSTPMKLLRWRLLQE